MEALRLGAYDYLVKPLDFDSLKSVLHKAIEQSCLSVENRELRRQLSDTASMPGIIGRSSAIASSGKYHCSNGAQHPGRNGFAIQHPGRYPLISS